MKRADPLLEQVSRMLGRYLPGDARHIVVALSGGADSVCLLHALLSLKPLHGCTLSAVHLNHLLRGQAAFEDAAFVEALCQRLGVELLSEQADVAALSRQRHIGEELAGRQAREPEADARSPFLSHCRFFRIGCRISCSAPPPSRQMRSVSPRTMLLRQQASHKTKALSSAAVLTGRGGNVTKNTSKALGEKEKLDDTVHQCTNHRH